MSNAISYTVGAGVLCLIVLSLFSLHSQHNLYIRTLQAEQRIAHPVIQFAGLPVDGQDSSLRDLRLNAALGRMAKDEGNHFVWLTGQGDADQRSIFKAAQSPPKKGARRVEIASELASPMSIPTYYINLDEDVDRRTYMEYVFEPLMRTHTLTRVNALKLTNMDLLLKHLDPEQAPDAKDLHKRQHFVTYEKFKALPGQLGNTFSHLEAVRMAYLQNQTSALVLEDDVSDQLRWLWPVPLDELIAIANSMYPNWGAIRLQWNDYAGRVDDLHKKWREAVSEWLAQGLAFHDLWRETGSFWDGSPSTAPPILMRHGSGWGNVATIFSRRGMQKLMDFHYVHTKSALEEGTDDEKTTWNVWRCHEGFSCTADLSFWPALDAADAPVLIATPPYFTYRLAEIQTPHIRKGQKKADHGLLHLQSVSRAFQWALEFEEFFKPGGLEGLRLNYTWDVIGPPEVEKK